MPNLNDMDVAELARSWIAVPSHSAISNRPLVEQMDRDLTAMGFEVQTYLLRGNDPDDPEKLNLIATLGSGPRRVVLSGHSDTVPVGDESLWTRDPMGEIADGTLFGCGSVDIKGPTACAVMAAVNAHRAGKLGDIEAVIAVSADEEVGHIGVKQFGDQYPFENVVGVVVVEPTSMSAINAHKGGTRIEVHVHGKNCHSSQPWEGVNAIEQAHRFIGEFEAVCAEWNQRRHPAFGSNEGPTAPITGIVGFQAVNVIPDRCTITIGARPLCREDREDLLQRLDRLIGDLSDEDSALSADRRFSADVVAGSDASAMATSADNPWYTLVRTIRGQQHPQFVRFGTDGGEFSEMGLPSVVCGPGDISQAHQPNEHIDLNALYEGTEQLRDILIAAAEASSLSLPAVDGKK